MDMLKYKKILFFLLAFPFFFFIGLTLEMVPIIWLQ